MSDPHPYSRLTPDLILNALETLGLRCDGRLLALNSYENRVYQAGVEDGPFVVAKFYRPARWSDEQILEEHAFGAELADAEIPVVAPSVYEGRTLHRFDGFRFDLASTFRAISSGDQASGSKAKVSKRARMSCTEAFGSIIVKSILASRRRGAGFHFWMGTICRHFRSGCGHEYIRSVGAAQGVAKKVWV